jgi:hypothetical protein
MNNQKQELPVAAMFVNESGRNEQYRGPSKDAPYQVSIHLGKRFQRRFFRNQPIRNKNGLWRLFLEMVNICFGDFLARLAKGNVNLCHHLASVVR